VLLVAHVNPDADALGSTLAVAIALETLGVDAQVSFPDDPFEVPLGLRFLPRQDLIVAPERAAGRRGDEHGRLLRRSDRSLCSGWGEAPAFIAVDHHASFVPFAPLVHVDAGRPRRDCWPSTSSTRSAWTSPRTWPPASMRPISSDTGSFRFASTTPESMRAAARLMETGIDFAGAAKAMFDTKSRDFLGCRPRSWADLEVLTAGGRRAVAVISVSRQDRDRHGIAFTQVESLIDAVRTVEGVEVAVVLKQDDHGLSGGCRAAHWVPWTWAGRALAGRRRARDGRRVHGHRPTRSRPCRGSSTRSEPIGR
jgi:phosphoesterase RecJ-like protein